jgi:iron complex transport system substrate-binding protein
MAFRRSTYRLLFLLLLIAAGICSTLASGCASRNLPERNDQFPPRRIVSMTLATDEILPELVPMDRIVGVTFLVDDPEISNVSGRYPAHIPRLRDASAEHIFGLTPDLVCLAEYNSIDFVNLLERSGLSIYKNESVNSLDEVEAGIEKLAERVGETERGRKLAERVRSRRKEVAAKLAGMQNRPRVLFWSAGYTAGPRSAIDDLIRESGGTNVAGELGLGASSEITPELMVSADPDYILLCRWAGDDRPNEVSNHPILRNLRAVRTNHVLSVEGRYVTSVSQYVADALDKLARLLHPECFREAAP